VQKAAKRATIAVPALAVSGALAAAPQALAATTPRAHATPLSASTHPISAQLDAAVQSRAAAFSTYTVQPGDTLSGIAFRLLGRASGWHQLYWRNRSQISNPNLIFPGMVLAIPRHLTTADQRWPGTGGQQSTASQSGGGQQSTASQSGGGQQSTPSQSGGGQQSTPSQSGGGQQNTPGQSSGSQQSAQQSTSQSQTSSQSQSSGANSASLSAAVQGDITSGNDLLAVAQYLVANGYSDAAAAGVASCVDGESGGNPESVGTGGGGLIGWTPISSAAPNPNIITGNPAQDMETQLSDLLYYNSNEIGQSFVDELDSQTDPVAAADFYSQNFEKPAVTDSDVVPSVAEQIFSALGG
jgi:hypothetical protein